MTGGIRLSARLKAAADMVTPGNRVCDVGCDHGYLSIYLIEQRISPKAFAMDVREGPLGRAREHVLRAGLEDYITLRLSDGLAGFETGEAETLVCAGMGGRLMERILSREPAKTKSFRELILQPQSELTGFRRFLREQGYFILWEDMIWEEGKFYPIMKAALKGQATCRLKRENRQELEDRFGPILLERRHPVLFDYLKREKESAGRLEAMLKETGKSEKAMQRFEELEEEIKYMEEAMRLWEKGGV